MKYKLKKFDCPIAVTRLANIHYFEFTNEYHTISDSHSFCELVYVDNGEIIVNSEAYSGILGNNQLIIHSPNELHSLKCDEKIAPNVIIIGFECDSERLLPFSQSPVTLSSENKKMLAEIMKEGMSVYAPPYDLPNTLNMKKKKIYPFGADQMIRLKLESLLIALIRECETKKLSAKSNSQASGNIAEIHSYITENYTEKILLDNICFLFGTNKTSLCRNFKNEYGTTVFNYINALKIKKAKEMLREDKLSVTEISESLGFNSVHYFCRVFKKAAGQSPKSYVKTVKSRLEL